MIKFKYVSIFAAAALLLSACSSPEAILPTPVTEMGEPGIGEETQELHFGDTMSWDDGVSITVTGPELFTPSEFAGGVEEGMEYVYFTYVLANNSDETLDPDVMLLVASDGERSEDIFDEIENVGNTDFWPSEAIESGESVTWITAHNVKNSKDVSVQVGPGYDYDDAIFTSN